MAQDAAGADDQVVDPRGDGVDIWRADEHAEGIVLFGHGPGTAARLGQVHFAAPAGHDDVLVAAAGALEAQAQPERDRGRQVVARHDGEGADGGSLGHG